VGPDLTTIQGEFVSDETKCRIAIKAANIYEITTHLRGKAGARQVDGARIGLTHVVGLGSACAVHILEKT
jgi:hypothetical protein